MKLAEDIRPVTQMKTGAAALLRTVRRTRRPLVITQHGQAQAVLLDIATYEELKNAMLMLRIVARGDADAQAGRTLSVESAFERVGRAIQSTARHRG